MSKTANIGSFFGKGTNSSTVATLPPVSVSSSTAKVSSSDPVFEDYTPREKQAHQLAKEMLGTSYDPLRTNRYIKSLKK
jgi:hypothetical protein